MPYAATAHKRTSQQADRSSILGRFAQGANLLVISGSQASADDPHLYFEMDAKADGFYQTAVAELADKRLTRSERFDIVFGSGVRGQTYGYWSGDQLSELPVSYWTQGQQWINSPGYRDGTANFARHINPRCLECHASYIKALTPDAQGSTYEKASLVVGISCENCHGPGAAHITSAASNRSSAASRAAILNPANFSRDRQVDACALCHNGTQREELIPAFSYRPGQVLDDFLAPNAADTAERPDVHGNQVGLLKRSRCFTASPAMTCSTCHEVHAPERTAASYSDRCLSCHQWQACGVSKTLGHSITQNCIDCHMPRQETQAVVSITAGKTIGTSMRTHWIKVYQKTEPHSAAEASAGLAGTRDR